MATTYVLGIDSSTQSTKALLVDAGSGEVVAEQRSPHPDDTEVDPRAWLAAVDAATDGLIEKASAVAVAGQQHGMVALDESGEVVRDALLWNDTRSSEAADELVREMGGPAASAERTGSVLVASMTSTKLRWMQRHEPENAEHTHTVVLPHDYVSHHLAAPGTRRFTDRGDASGTGYFSPQSDGWDPELARMALGHDFERPEILRPHDQAGETAQGALLGPGTGDNMAAALGLGMQPGDVSLSIGTSGVAAMVTSQRVADEEGSVAGFADAAGGFLPLACTLNAAKILDWACSVLAVDHDALAELALESPPGANGTVLLPYLDGERTPNRPQASGVFRGLTSRTTREDIARAAFEGLACSLADATEALMRVSGERPRRILVIGGAARNVALQRILPTVFEETLHVPEPGEYVALGAAVQAAWVLSGGDRPPRWEVKEPQQLQGEFRADVLDAYRTLKDATVSW